MSDAICLQSVSLFQEFPNHVAVELDLLYVLNFGTDQAYRESAQGGLAAARELQQRFLRQHLGRWMGPFSTAVPVGAQTAFCRELATLIEAFIRMETAPPRHTGPPKIDPLPTRRDGRPARHD